MANRKNKKDLYIEKIKLEVAEELGLLDKILSEGWGALNATEAGRIGGKVAGRLKKEGMV